MRKSNRVLPKDEQKIRVEQRIEAHARRKLAAIRKEKAKYVDGRGTERILTRTHG